MTLDELLLEAADLGVNVKYAELGDCRGQYRHSARLIVINQRLSADQARVTLAHEVAHAVYCDVGTSPEMERRADRYAARLLISARDYAAAERMHGPHAGAIARELGVTRHLVETWRGCQGRRLAG